MKTKKLVKDNIDFDLRNKRIDVNISNLLNKLLGKLMFVEHHCLKSDYILLTYEELVYLALIVTELKSIEEIKQKYGVKYEL